MDTRPATEQHIVHPTTFIALNRLKFGHEHPKADVNIRRPDPDSAAALARSIREEGLLQALLVAPDPDHGGEGPYYTIAGGRRLLALQKLRDDGVLAADAPISCVVASDAQFDFAGALAKSLACEDTHVPPHPVDRYEAFARLAAAPMTAEEIAGRFFVEPRTVKQALALGELAPEIRAAWRAGEIGAELAQLFTLADDAKHQAKILAKLKKKFGAALDGVRADTVRKEFTGSEAEARRWLAFVGRDAYLAAGGRLTEDLFAGTAAEPALIVHDVAKLKKLATEKLEIEARRLTDGDGWSWAETALKPPHTFGFGHAKATPSYTAEEKSRLAAIAKERRALDAVEDEDVFDYEKQERLDEERDRIEAAAALRAYTPAQKAKAGVIVSIDSSGALKLDAGLVKPKEREGDDTRNGAASAQPRKAEDPALNYEALNAVHHARNAAISAALVKNGRAALAALLATAGAPWGAPIGVEVQIRGGTSKSWSALFAHHLARDFDELVADVVAMTAAAVDVGHTDEKSVDALAGTLDPALYGKTLSEAFEAKRYFAGASVKHMLTLIEEDLGEDERRRCAEKSAKQLAAFCLDSVAVKGWLPPELRGPGYQPSKARPRAQAEEEQDRHEGHEGFAHQGHEEE